MVRHREPGSGPQRTPCLLLSWLPGESTGPFESVALTAIAGSDRALNEARVAHFVTVPKPDPPKPRFADPYPLPGTEDKATGPSAGEATKGIELRAQLATCEGEGANARLRVVRLRLLAERLPEADEHAVRLNCATATNSAFSRAWCTKGRGGGWIPPTRAPRLARTRENFPKVFPLWIRARARH